MQRIKRTGNMPAPMDAMQEGPVPQSFASLTLVKQHQAGTDVLVGIEQVIAYIAHQGLIPQQGIRIENFAIVPAGEGCQVGNGILQCGGGQFG